jgi:hypothetical protein
MASQSTLPPGLGLSDSNFLGTPLISGIPTTIGTYNVVVTVADSASPSAQTSKNYTISINPPPPLSINTTPAPSAGAVNLPYKFRFTAIDGLAPLIWSESGALPPGLVFADDGQLSGTPTATGSFPITVFSHGFRATGSMESARSSHTATLLGNGNVLVAGGFSDTGGLTTAELFNPTSGSFTSTGSMQIGRFQQTATLLTNGKVLLPES